MKVLKLLLLWVINLIKRGFPVAIIILLALSYILYLLGLNVHKYIVEITDIHRTPEFAQSFSFKFFFRSMQTKGIFLMVTTCQTVNKHRLKNKQHCSPNSCSPKSISLYRTGQFLTFIIIPKIEGYFLDVVTYLSVLAGRFVSLYVWNLQSRMWFWRMVCWSNSVIFIHTKPQIAHHILFVHTTGKAVTGIAVIFHMLSWFYHL